MLILIAGITGNLGKELALAGLAAGHTVRGLGRTPSKLPADIASKLESFVESKNWDDVPALDKATAGVDAVICAYTPQPIPSLDGQLMLLRACERAGVKRYHAASWNLNWSKSPLGLLETYDAYISFMYQARLTSSIKPLYTSIGVFALTFFAVPGAGQLEGDKAIWQRLDGGKRRINVIGTGDEKIDMTTEADAAAFSVALITSDKAEAGGHYQFRSDSFTLKEFAALYKKIKGDDAEWNVTGLTPEVCDGIISSMRTPAIANNTVYESWYNWIGLVYVKYMLNGEMALDKVEEDLKLFPEVTAKRTTLEKYITTSPDI
jgi:nucleoside-diphosphate-sugar epimerase